MRAVVDTNVILVANNAHEDVSPECVIACIDTLQALTKSGKVVIDDAYRILSEYQNKTSPMRSKGPGDVFVRWLLQNTANTRYVEQVPLTETARDEFAEFPVPELQASVDAPDRKFMAVAAGAKKPPPKVVQATDCKWLDWWQPLQHARVTIEFLCPGDVCRFYDKKFPRKKRPPLP